MIQNYLTKVFKRITIQKLALPVILLLLSCALNAQQVSITGRIAAAGKNTPLQGATISVKGANKSVTSSNEILIE